VAEATEDVLRVQLPALRRRITAGDLQVDNIDVFCERGVFDLDATRAILQAGRDMGLHINFHGDELHPMNSAQVLVGLL
jgi:imidazolonepropionase